MTMRLHLICSCIAFALLAGACSTNTYLSEVSSKGALSDETLLRHSSGEQIEFSAARVITENDEAFLSKLALVESAQSTIDLAYYIFADDYTSSALASALIAATKRGVRVRLLLDYASTYANLDMFSMLQVEGNKGSGSLEVRFYNRPTRNIVMDAAYVSLRCSEIGEATGCSREKMDEIAAQFDAEMIDGVPAADLGISNLDVGGSGIFLSGFYSKRVDLVALAVMEGREMPSGGGDSPELGAEQIEGLLKLARIYWRSRTGNVFQRLVANIQLAAISVVAGDVVDPLYEAVAENLPIERRDLQDALRDWDYSTDYLHQKLLLVDRSYMQLGGRNIEDTYHLLDAQLESGVRFMDTDVRIAMTSGGASIEQSFERIWNLRQMVATLPEVRQHAPNDLVANMDAFTKANEKCDAGSADDNCFDREFGALAQNLEQREAMHYQAMQSHAAHFQDVFRQQLRDQAPESLEIDSGAQIYYIENIPFSGKYGEALQGRSLGAENGREARSGKRIHAVALAGMQNACVSATAENPKRVILNNAYFFPPSNLVDMLARMLDGSLDCRHVELTIITNSNSTTDLAIVNMLGRHVAFAFTDYLRSLHDPERGASFRYYEIQPNEGSVHHSLHSKVWVLGDDMIVGSANADVRSYMMDANNAVVIRDAPEMLGNYISNIDASLGDTTRVRELSDYYLNTPREQAIEEDRQMFRGMISSVSGGRLSDAQMAQAEQKFVDLMNLIYSLTVEGLEGTGNSEELQARFNRIFKLI
jgi:putative cardiolipin synthase